MKILSRNRKLRFALEGPSPEEWLSDRWTAWVRKDDVYIAPSTSGHVHKISLHASGDCRLALTSNAFSHLTEAIDERVILRWRRNSHVDVEHTHVLSMYFLVIGSGFPVGKQDKKETVLLPPAPPLFATEVAIFYSGTNPLNWRSNYWVSSNIMGVWELDSSEYVTFRRRVIPFPDSRFQALLSQTIGIDHLIIGEPEPNAFSAGVASCMLSRGSEHFAEFFVLEKVDLSGWMGERPAVSVPGSDLRFLRKPE